MTTAFRQNLGQQQDQQSGNKNGHPVGHKIDRLIEHLTLLDEKKKKVKNHEAWLETALKENYAGKSSNIQKNREFAQRFKEHNQWSELHLTKNYCTHNRSSKDFQYHLPVHVFQKMLQECFEQYKGMDD